MSAGPPASHESNMETLPKEATTSWRDIFGGWPAELPRRGVLVASFGEQMAFSNFAASEAFLLVERQSPDSAGARTVLLPYDHILGLKIVDVIKWGAFKSLGFDLPVQK